MEVCEYRYRLVAVCFRLDLRAVNHYLGMKYLLDYALVDIVTDRADEHSLRESGNLARRNEAVHLRVERVAHILTVDGDRLTLLENLAEAFREGFGGFTHDLPGEDVADGVHYNRRLLVAVVALELREILKTQTHGNLVASCGSY